MSDGTLSNDELVSIRQFMREVREIYWIAPDADKYVSPIIELTGSLPEPLSDLTKTFAQNLKAPILIAGFPVHLAWNAAVQVRFARLVGIAHLQLLADQLGADPSEEFPPLDDRSARANDLAQREMDAFLGSDRGAATILRAFGNYLLADRSGSGREPALELLLQSTVLAWSALEVLARDLFTIYINHNPHAVAKLLAEPTAKRRFELTKFPLDVLGAYGFDVSRSLGTILSAQQDFSDFTTIKAVYSALFDCSPELRSAFDVEAIRLLALRRHLVVHRRGVVDAGFRASTRCKEEVGQRLGLSPNAVQDALDAVKACGLNLLQVASLRGAWPIA